MPVLTIASALPLQQAGTLIAPLPPDTWHQRVRSVSVERANIRGVLRARNGNQCGLVLSVATGEKPMVRFDFDEIGPGLFADDFEPVDSRFERVSPSIVAQAKATVANASGTERVGRLMQFVADRFSYGNREKLLGDETDAIQSLDVCELTTGNCIDMHTVGVAALRAIGIPSAYVVGCFVPLGSVEYPTGHCWLNLDAGDASVAHHYDISHHVEYGLGSVTPTLNPKPGQRFALGIGRGLVFEGLEGPVELPSLSGFYWLEGAGKGHKVSTIGRFDG